jgi:hypothetical protein
LIEKKIVIVSKTWLLNSNKNKIKLERLNFIIIQPPRRRKKKRRQLTTSLFSSKHQLKEENKEISTQISNRNGFLQTQSQHNY